MGAGRKEYELIFKLQAALGGNFNSSFKSAMSVTNQLQGNIVKLNSLQGKIDGYQKQSQAIEDTKTKLSKLNEEHSRLQNELRETSHPTEALKRKFEQNELQIEKATTAIGKQKTKLSDLRLELSKSGISTANLGDENDKLTQSYERAKKEQETFSKIIADQEKTNAAIAKTKGKLLGTVGAAAALGTAIYAGPVQSAMEFESAMADVVKVVDGLKDGKTGQLTQEYYNMKKGLIDLSVQVPMTAKDLTAIAASAGQAGIARQEIIGFSEDAAKMGIAFDVTAEQAGDWMAKWRTAFGMSQTDVVDLADTVNMLSDRTASSATEIANIVTKVGPLGEVAGMTSGKIAAMGAALVSVGVKDDVAATGIKKLLIEMTAGSSATKKQISVLDKMGESATEMAERMQTDAQGAVLDFLEAINKLPKAEQAAALSDYFGTESVGAIAPMLTKLDLLKASFEQVGDSAQYAGSMEREFESRSATTENKITLAKNSLNRLCIVLGDTFLPAITTGAEKLSELITKFSDWAAKNPEAIQQLAKLAGGFLALKGGTQIAKLGFLEVKSGVQGVQKIIKLFTSDVTKAGTQGAASLGGAAKAGSLLKGAFSLLTSPVGIVVAAIAAITGGIFLFMQAQEQARQETLHFADDLKVAADSFQKVSDKATSTQALTDEYRKLNEKTKDVATSADEAAAAKDRMKQIEQDLIAQNPDVISKYDAENGKILENLDLLEEKSKKELELSKMKFEQQQYDAEQQLPDALKQVSELSGKSESLKKEYDEAKKIRDALDEVTAERDRIVASNNGKQMSDEQRRALSDSAAKALGEDRDFTGNLTNIDAEKDIYNDKAIKASANSTKANEELTTVTKSVKDYYDSSVKLVELDLGGSFQAVTDKLAGMKTELAEFKKDGNKMAALETEGKIAELEPKLMTAAATIRDLGTSISAVPEVKTINVENATKSIDGFLAKLKRIPPTTKTTLLVEKSNGKIQGYATGGIITSPTLATFAEKVPEAAIPLDGSASSKALWVKTGNLLGVEQARTASNVTAPTLGAEPRREARIVIHSNPIFQVGKDTNTADIERALKARDEALIKDVEERIRKREDDEKRGRYD